MKCPDCKTEVRFNPEYCPHCSAELFKKKGRAESTRVIMVNKLWINAGIL